MSANDEGHSSGKIEKKVWRPNFVLIAIDTHPSMFIKKENEDGTITHPFKDCLTACYEIADSLIFKNGSRFAIAFINSDDKANFIDNDVNLLDAVKLLKKTSSLSNEELKKCYERQGDIDLAAFFLHCKKKFTKKEESFSRKFIVITVDDNPVKDDPNKRFTALNEVQTFAAINIKFDIIAMRNDFCYTHFYNELFSLFDKTIPEESICEDKDGLVEFLRAVIFSYTRKRKFAFYPFIGDYTRYVNVMQVDFIREAKFNTSKVAPDSQPVKRVVDEGWSNKSNNIEYQVKRPNDEPIAFTAKEKQDMVENKLPMGFNLMYTSSRMTDVGMVLTPPSLLQVSRKETLQFFDQFWQYCVENKCVLVCIKKIRKSERIRFVELLPKFVNNDKMFLIKSIPYCTEILIPRTGKSLNIENENTTESRKELINKFIETFSFDYDPTLLPDPKYSKKKAYIKAKLLDEPYVEPRDSSIPSGADALDDIISQIKSKFGLHDPNQGTKRKASASASRSKKIK